MGASGMSERKSDAADLADVLVRLRADAASGRLPFQRWARARGLDAWRLGCRSDLELREAVLEAYGGARSVQTLMACGLERLISRDICATLGDEGRGLLVTGLVRQPMPRLVERRSPEAAGNPDEGGGLCLRFTPRLAAAAAIAVVVTMMAASLSFATWRGLQGGLTGERLAAFASAKAGDAEDARAETSGL